MAVLYMVATPIGNMDDITLRAIETLRTVELILCEDTRHSRRLLQHHGIQTPVAAWHAYSRSGEARRIIERIGQIGSAACISDAGTPGISDPGTKLVRRARQAGYTVVPIPGPSAPAALFSVGGIPGKGYVFEGFLSPKQGRRRKALGQLIAAARPFILFESPHRIVKLLADLAEHIPEGEITIGRELTKRFEEVWSGTCEQAYRTFSSRKKQQGEFTVLVNPAKTG